MAQRPSPPPSPQARRQAHVLSLRQALAQRDRLGVDGLLGQWVHRHGVDGLEPLLQELERDDPEGLSWWRLGEPKPEPEPNPEPASEPEPLVTADPAPAQLDPIPLVVAERELVPEESAPEPIPEPVSEPEPVVTAAPAPIAKEALKRSVRRRPGTPRPAPAPSHPALAELRSWLPSSEDSRAA